MKVETLWICDKGHVRDQAGYYASWPDQRRCVVCNAFARPHQQRRVTDWEFASPEGGGTE